MLQIQEMLSVGSKTTMKIGGTAHYYAEIATKEDVEEAWKFAREKNIPLIPLGGGSNTIFADGTTDALVIRIKADSVNIDVDPVGASRRDATTRVIVQSGNASTSLSVTSRVTVQAGKILPSLINELANQNLDLSALTGILGTVGGAVFGNAGQGPGGIWIGHYVESVTAFIGESDQRLAISGQWKTFSKEQCKFRYRESYFKDITQSPKNQEPNNSQFSIHNSQFPIIWETTLNVPSKPAAEVKVEVERLLKKRIETQPHLKTAGSCFKALPDGTPAWQLIDAAGLRGFRVGDIQIAEKHANFLLNVGEGSFEDAVKVVETVKEKVPQIAGVEMRFFGKDGRVLL